MPQNAKRSEGRLRSNGEAARKGPLPRARKPRHVAVARDARPYQVRRRAEDVAPYQARRAIAVTRDA